MPPKTYTELEREAFTVSEQAWHKLGANLGKITGDKYTHYIDNNKWHMILQWWAIDPAAELELRLTDFANTTEWFPPRPNSTNLFSIYTGDHGKGKLCFVAKLCWEWEQGKEGNDSVSSIADVKCKKGFRREIQEESEDGFGCRNKYQGRGRQNRIRKECQDWEKEMHYYRFEGTLTLIQNQTAFMM